MLETMRNGNPCQRLHDFLAYLRRQRTNVAIKDIICDFFGVDPDDTDAVYQVFSQSRALAREARQEITFNSRLTERQKTEYLRPFREIDLALDTLSPRHNLQGFKEAISESALATLRAAALAVETDRDEVLINVEALNQLRQEVEDLYARIDESDLDISIKRVLARLLETVRWAIITIRLDGQDGLDRATIFCAAVVQIHKDQLGGTGDENDKRPPFLRVAMDRLRDFMTAANAVNLVRRMLGAGSDTPLFPG